MELRSRTVVRAPFVALVLVSLSLRGLGFLKWSVIEGGADVLGSGVEPVASASGTTVVTTSIQGDDRIAADAANVWADRLPTRMKTGLLYVLPPWIGVVELGGLLALPVVRLAWGATELYWSSYPFRKPVTKGGDREP